MAIPFCLPSDEDTEDNYRRLEQLLADIYDVLRIILTRQNSIEHHHQSTTYQDSILNGSQIYDEEEHMAQRRRLNSMSSVNSSNSSSRRGSIDDVHRRLAHLPDLVLSTLPNQTQNNNNNNCAMFNSRQSNCDSSSLQSFPPKVPPRKYKKKSSKYSSYLIKEKSMKSSFSSESDALSIREQSWLRVGKELRNIAEDFRTQYKETNKGKEPIDLPALKTSSLFALLLPTPLRNRSVWTTVILIVGWKIFLRQR